MAETGSTSGSAPHRVNVLGHERAARMLLAGARHGSMGQAHLLAGPPGIGKETLARQIAQALLCTSPDPEARPCGNCRSCRLVFRGAHPDCQTLSPPLRIDAVRELQHMLSLAPSEGAVRIGILADVDDATPAASNCLLKTLEEPPPHAMLFLTAADGAAVLPTVRSRCQVVALRPLPVEQVALVLRDIWSAPPEQAELLGRLSHGRLGWAVRALADESLLARRAAWLDGLSRALAAGRAERVRIAADLARDAESLPDCLACWISWWRDVLLYQHGVRASVANRDRLEALAEAAPTYRSTQIVAVLEALLDTLARLSANTNPQLAAEVLLLELPS